MLRIIDMREATGTSSSFAIFNTVTERFIELGKEMCWDGLPDFVNHVFDTYGKEDNYMTDLVKRISHITPEWARSQ